MSSRKNVKKITYVCRDGHVTKQRADKPTPTICSGRFDVFIQRVGNCTLPVFNPETKQAEKKLSQIVTSAPKTRKKVTR